MGIKAEKDILVNSTDNILITVTLNPGALYPSGTSAPIAISDPSSQTELAQAAWNYALSYWPLNTLAIADGLLEQGWSSSNGDNQYVIIVNEPDAAVLVPGYGGPPGSYANMIFNTDAELSRLSHDISEPQPFGVITLCEPNAALGYAWWGPSNPTWGSFSINFL